MSTNSCSAACQPGVPPKVTFPARSLAGHCLSFPYTVPTARSASRFETSCTSELKIIATVPALLALRQRSRSCVNVCGTFSPSFLNRSSFVNMPIGVICGVKA